MKLRILYKLRITRNTSPRYTGVYCNATNSEIVRNIRQRTFLLQTGHTLRFFVNHGSMHFE